jgi:alpha 1,3-glucosidase
MENQFLCGADLLVKPVVAPGQHSTSVYFPGGKDARWFDVEDFTEAPGGIEAVVNTPLDKMPVFQRGGSVVSRKVRVRRSSKLMYNDPFTLTVALDREGAAEGTLYMDDEHTFDHQKGVYRYRKFTYSGGTFTGGDAGSKGAWEREGGLLGGGGEGRGVRG